MILALSYNGSPKRTGYAVFSIQKLQKKKRSNVYGKICSRRSSKRKSVEK